MIALERRARLTGLLDDEIGALHATIPSFSVAQRKLENLVRPVCDRQDERAGRRRTRFRSEPGFAPLETSA